MFEIRSMEVNRSIKNIIKIILISITLLLLFYFPIDQKRNFYCLDKQEKCITIWKRVGGHTYIIPEKYFGVFKPSDCIKTGTTNAVTFIYDKNSNYDFIVHNNYGGKLSIDSSNYSIKYFPYDEFDDFVEKYYNKNNKVKKGIKYLQIDIAENLVILNGEKIE